MMVRMQLLKKFLSFSGRGSAFAVPLFPKALDRRGSSPALEGRSSCLGATDGLPAAVLRGLRLCLLLSCFPALPGAKLCLLFRLLGLRVPRVCLLLMASRAAAQPMVLVQQTLLSITQPCGS